MPVVEVRGREAQQVISNAEQEDEVQELTDHFEDRGWKKSRVETAVLETDEPDISYYTVVFPFEIDSPDEQANILWLSSRQYPTRGYHIRRLREERQTRNWQIVNFSVEDSQVVSVRSIIPAFLGCDDVDWACIAKIIGTYGATTAACGTCIQTFNWAACLTCLSAIINQVGEGLLPCDWCNDNNSD